MVEWFYPYNQNEVEFTEENWIERSKLLTDFIRQKVYYDSNFKYILITNFGKSIII